MKIFKYPLDMAIRQHLFLPKGTKILDVQIQGQAPCLWALVDENALGSHVPIAIYGTGHPVPDDPGVYIATFQFDRLVFHVFAEENT